MGGDVYERERAAGRASKAATRTLQEEEGATSSGSAAMRTVSRRGQSRDIRAAMQAQDAGAQSEESDLDKLVNAGKVAKGKVPHSTAQDADAAIQKHLAKYVKSAVKEGRKIEGKVAVVGDVDWDKAGENHYGKSKWHTTRPGTKSLYRDSINGFVDGAGRVWIHKDRGDAGTMIHEAIHKYSDPALIAKSQPLNEGVTEFFTRKVCDAAGINILARKVYEPNRKCVANLAKLVGENKVASAYFDGKVDQLKKEFVAKKSQSDWTSFIAATKINDWQTAQSKCQ